MKRLLKQYVIFCFLLLLTISSSTNVSSGISEWELVGKSGFNSGRAAGFSLYVSHDIEKVVLVGYISQSKGNGAVVRRYDEENNRWPKVGGDEICEGAIKDIGVAFNASLESRDYYVAYKDLENGGRATVMKCNKEKNVWEVVGKKGFTAGEVIDLKFILDNLYPHVAFIDKDNGRKPVVMTYMNDEWIKLQIDENDVISEKQASEPAFCIDRGVNYVAFADRTCGDKLTVMMFDMPWIVVGQKGISDGRINYPAIFVERNRKAKVTRAYAAYQDYARDKKLTVMINDNQAEEWTALGEKGFSQGKIQHISLFVYKHIPFVAFADCANEYKATVMYYHNDAWRFLGRAGFSESGVTDIKLQIVDDTAYVGYIRTDKDKKIEVQKINVLDYINTN
ncbi:MAG: hypothetical protein JW822_07770 [Spirochaetales bacterium]|nr:hypothetical protein [Spirochaetales bacterium]